MEEIEINILDFLFLYALDEEFIRLIEFENDPILVIFGNFSQFLEVFDQPLIEIYDVTFGYFEILECILAIFLSEAERVGAGTSPQFVIIF